jgi:hypothetical protein
VTDSLIWLLPLALTVPFGWCLARGWTTGTMKTIYMNMPSAAKAEEPKLFWLLAGFNLFCLCGSILMAFYLSR